MRSSKFIHLWLLLLLALGPVASALAAGTCGAGVKHHHLVAMQDAQDSNAHTGIGHEHGSGHNHATCGTACMAALVSCDSSLTVSTATFYYSSLFIPVTGMAFPPHIRPPQVS